MQKQLEYYTDLLKRLVFSPSLEYMNQHHPENMLWWEINLKLCKIVPSDHVILRGPKMPMYKLPQGAKWTKQL